MSYQKVAFKGKIVEVATELINETEYVFLQDVQLKFRRVTSLSLNGRPLRFIRDTKTSEYTKPIRIKALPDVVIDGEQSEDDTAEHCAVALEQLDLKLGRIDQKIDNVIENQEVLLARTNAILQQAYELAEFTVPRLFIVLPDSSFKFDPRNIFQNRYRLFFLCEGTTDAEVHLALHEGYLIKQPREFFLKYGPYLCNMITVMKVAVTVAGCVVPVLVNVAPNIQIPEFLKQDDFGSKFSEKLERMSTLLDNLLGDEMGSKAQNWQLVEGVDLREIMTFLDRHDACKTLGNLSRITTDTGNVRWVCLHHFNKNYLEKRQEESIRQFKGIGGEYEQETASALVKDRRLSSSEVSAICNAVKNGLNLYSLKFDRCEMSESSCDSLLMAIKTHSFLKVLKLFHVTLTTLSIRQAEMLIYEKAKKTLSGKKNLELKIIVIPDDLNILASARFLVKCTGLNPDNSSLPFFNFHHTDGSDCITYVERIQHGFSFGEPLLDDTALTKIVEKESSIMAVGGELSEDFLRKVNDILQKNNQLETLVFGSCWFGSWTNRALEILLTCNASIAKLHFIHCRRLSNTIIALLVQFLQKNHSLQELKISSSNVTPTQVAALCKALEANTSVEKLSLAGNQMYDGGETAVARLLLHNKTLKSINLCRTNILNEGCKAMWNSLKVNNTLLFLDLSYNYFGWRCYNEVLEVLHVNTALKQLHLNETSLKPIHVLAILASLKRNETLETIDLRQSDEWMITKRDATLLQTVCDENQTMKKIKLNLHFETAEIRQSIEKLTIIDTS